MVRGHGRSGEVRRRHTDQRGEAADVRDRNVELDLEPKPGGASADPEREREREDFADLLAWMATALADDVKDVRLSTRPPPPHQRGRG